MSLLFSPLSNPDALIASVMSNPATGVGTRAFIWEQGILTADVPIATTSTNIFTGQFTFPPLGVNFMMFYIATVQFVLTGAATIRMFQFITGATSEQNLVVPAGVTSVSLTGHLLQTTQPGTTITYSTTAVASVGGVVTAKLLGLSGSASSRNTFIGVPGPIPL